MTVLSAQRIGHMIARYGQEAQLTYHSEAVPDKPWQRVTSPQDKQHIMARVLIKQASHIKTAVAPSDDRYFQQRDALLEVSGMTATALIGVHLIAAGERFHIHEARLLHDGAVAGIYHIGLASHKGIVA